jgi:hypothetical protein
MEILSGSEDQSYTAAVNPHMNRSPSPRGLNNLFKSFCHHAYD